MRREYTATLGLAILVLLLRPVRVDAQSSVVTMANAQPTPLEMAPLERLVGGRWHLGDDSYQTFAWGVGRRSVKAEQYFVGPDGAKLVGETTFLFHPGKQSLVAMGVAVDMGIDMFEFTAIDLRGDTLVLDLNAYGPQAGDDPMRETWRFIDTDHFEWTLWTRAEGGAWTRLFGGTYERR